MPLALLSFIADLHQLLKQAPLLPVRPHLPPLHPRDQEPRASEADDLRAVPGVADKIIIEKLDFGHHPRSILD
jgi:hypothetical protein